MDGNQHNLKVLSFFTKIAGHPHGEELGWIKPLSSNSCNYVLSSANSFGCILYALLDIGVVPGFNSITNSISLSRDRPGRSSGTTSRNSNYQNIFDLFHRDCIDSFDCPLRCLELDEKLRTTIR
jgi:hypothetical protein